MAAVAAAGFASEESAALCERIAAYLRSGETPALIALEVIRDGSTARVFVDFVHVSPMHMAIAAVTLLRVTANRLRERPCGGAHVHQIAGLLAAADDIEQLHGLLTIADPALPH